MKRYCMCFLLIFALTCGCDLPADAVSSPSVSASAAQARIERTPTRLALVYLAGGPFLMGQKVFAGKKALPLAEPVHKVVHSPFWIGQ